MGDLWDYIHELNKFLLIEMDLLATRQKLEAEYETARTTPKLDPYAVYKKS